MTEAALVIPALPPEPEAPGVLVWRRFRRHRLALVSVVLVGVMTLSALLASFSPYTSTEQEPANAFQAPTAAHWFGTDELGRDIFTRILYGGRISLAVGFFSTLVTLLIGVWVGALSGYYGGWLDNALMRLTDTFLSFPTTFVLILLGALLRDLPFVQLRNSALVVTLVIGLLSWMLSARLVRGLFLVLRERDFVSASRALGAGDGYIIFRHILPNCVGPILVNGTLEMAAAIITESGLSYLGFGIQPPTPSWGNILASAQTHAFRAPWLAVFPGLMIFVTVMAINFIGDGLRDALDPFTVRAA
jgi:peptide/nickel transport system permease protein